MSILSFDMGGTSVKYGIWEDGLKDQGSFPTPKTFDGLKESMLEVLNTFKDKYTVDGVAISAPGSVDVDKGVIGGISAIPYIHNFPIQKELEEIFGVRVALENDANSAALAELWQGKAKDVDSALFVVVGTGIGGAVIQHRKLVKGRNLFGGEFGIMMLDKDTSFSMGGTAVKMAERYSRRMGKPSNTFSGQEVFKLAEEGDAIALEEENIFYDYLAQGVYNIMFTTDPEVIILGGGVTQHKPLISELKKRIDEKLEKTRLYDYKYDLTTCEFLNDANLVGAVYAYNVKYNLV